MENKRVKVIMLPTDRVNKGYNVFKIKSSSALQYLNIVSSAMVEEFSTSFQHLIPQHLYFTVDEKPEVGDWCVYFGTDIMKHDNNEVWDKDKCKKITSTTDTKLKLKEHQNGCMLDRCLTNACNDSCKLPQPSQAFIEAFCKTGGIWKVLVEYEEFIVVTKDDLLDSQNKAPRVWLPKVNSHNEITIHPIKSSWTREEVVAFGLECIQAARDVDNQDDSGIITIDEYWIKENLKL